MTLGTYSRLETTNSAFLRRLIYASSKRHNHKDPTQLKMRILFPWFKPKHTENRVSPRSALLEAVYLKALLYSKLSTFNLSGTTVCNDCQNLHCHIFSTKTFDS